MGEWKLESFEMGYALVCSVCGKKISLKDFIFADRDITVCPQCESKMELNIDEDEIAEYVKGDNRWQK